MAKMLDFREVRGTWYKFTWKGLDSEDWKGALEALKEIPLEERNYLENEKMWEVLKTPENEQKLAAIFKNGRSCIEMVRCQMRMFG